MDNLTHTLVGAALAEAGLKRRTTLGAATLMIGANFPDIDVIAVPLGVGIEVRRGVTHGFLALAVLPFVLAGIMWLWDSQVRRRRDRGAAPADFRQLVILAAISIATHPTLDFMNTYGMRWLMPFVDKWYYADGLFIVDVWMILMLVAGIVWSRRTNHPRWARVALLGVVAYTTAMLLVTSLGRMRTTSAFPGRRLMVEPQMLVPWRRDVLVEQDDFYQFGTYTPFQGLDMGARARGLAKGDRNPAVARARELPTVRPFLRWVRFPMYNVVSENGVTYVWISDARYKGAGWAVVEVALP
ncbi:MAG TPA: metal-dependent hydrolase [Gemmatimonadaceae bacterium]